MLSNVPKPDDKYVYRRYESCRIGFQTRIDQYLNKFSSKSDLRLNQPEAVLEDKTPSASPIPARTPRRFNVMESSLCFVRNTRQENEGAYYNDGKKGRSSLILSKAKLIEAQKIHRLDESSHFC